jgi:dethiobiotin synthetase
MTRSIFITATDTNAGKTWIATSLIRSMLQAGISAKALKPVACGMDTEGRNADITALLNTQRLQHVEEINLYHFSQPAAPSLAAATEHRSIDPNQLISWCRGKAEATDICLIEGVGGLMAPLTENYLVCDWIKDMPEAEIWLVVGCRLGSINHALLTLDKLKSLRRSPTHIIFNAANPADNNWLEPTQRAINPFLAKGCHVHALNHGSEIY